MAFVVTQEASAVLQHRQRASFKSPKKVPFLLRVASTGRLAADEAQSPGLSSIGDASTFTDDDDMFASFNSDLGQAAASLDWTLITIEGMLHDSVRPENLKCTEDVMGKFADIRHRLEAVVICLQEDTKGDATDEGTCSILKPSGADGAIQHREAAVERNTKQPAEAKRDAVPLERKNPENGSSETEHATDTADAAPSYVVSSMKQRLSLNYGSRDAKIAASTTSEGDHQEGTINRETSQISQIQEEGDGATESFEPVDYPPTGAISRMIWNLKHFLPPRVMPVGEKYIKEKFEALDADSSGELDRSEVEELLRQEGVPHDEALAILEKFDVDGDGVIQWAEFKGAIMGSEIWTRPLSNLEMVYLTFDDPSSSGLAKLVFSVVFWAILIAVLSMVLESLRVFRKQKLEVHGMPCSECLIGPDYEAALASGESRDALLHCRHCEPEPMDFFYIIESITVPIFTVEYCFRLFTFHAVKFMDLKVSKTEDADAIPLQQRLKKTLDFVIDPLNVLDLLAIIPFYLEFAFDSQGGGFGAARVFRLARIFRVFKLGKTNDGMKMFMRVMSQSYNALRIILFFLLLSMILFGCIIFEVEKGEWVSNGRAAGLDSCDHGCYVRRTTDQTGYEISPFTDIPISFWWVLVTQTTVGFGDMYPTSRLGHAVGVITMVMGILVLALPITVIGANFAGFYGLCPRVLLYCLSCLRLRKPSSVPHRGVRQSRKSRANL